MKYRVVEGTSVRASADPKSPAFETWVDFPAGRVVSEWPAHADVEGWVAAGHWQPVAEKPEKAEPVVEDDDGHP